MDKRDNLHQATDLFVSLLNCIKKIQFLQVDDDDYKGIVLLIRYSFPQTCYWKRIYLNTVYNL